MSVLAVNGLSRRYGSDYAVQDLSLSVQAGNVHGILGPNGSGKSTTLGMLLGVIRPTSGSFQWFDGTGSPAAARRRIGSILERPNFYHHLSGIQNLEITTAIRGRGREREIKSALDRVGLGPVRDQPFSQYSLGMRQRLSLAAALIGEPDVLVLDEPTNGIDAQGIADVRRIILQCAGEGKTILLASHILDEVQKVSSHISILKEGRVLESGPVDQVLGGGDFIEVACADAVALGRLLENLEIVDRFHRGADFFSVYLKEGSDAADLNACLVGAGQVPFHLVRARGSLENRYLELVREA